MRTRNVRKFLAPLPSLAGPSQLPRVKACPGSLGLRRVWRWRLTAGPDLGQGPSSCLPGRLSRSSQGSTGLVAVALSCQTRVYCAPGHFRDLCVRLAHRPGRREGPSSQHMPLPWHAVSFSDAGAGRAPASAAALLQKRRRREACRVRSWAASWHTRCPAQSGTLPTAPSLTRLWRTHSCPPLPFSAGAGPLSGHVGPGPVCTRACPSAWEWLLQHSSRPEAPGRQALA